MTELHFPANMRNFFSKSSSRANAKVFPSMTRPYCIFLVLAVRRKLLVDADLTGICDEGDFSVMIISLR